jgi:hypothetical protein
MADVLCTSQHAIDLDDGRTLGPGESADDIDLESAHNRALVLDGHLLVTEGKTPRSRADHRREREAATPKED